MSKESYYFTFWFCNRVIDKTDLVIKGLLLSSDRFRVSSIRNDGRSGGEPRRVRNRRRADVHPAFLNFQGRLTPLLSALRPIPWPSYRFSETPDRITPPAHYLRAAALIIAVQLCGQAKINRSLLGRETVSTIGRYWFFQFLGVVVVFNHGKGAKWRGIYVFLFY